MPCASNSVRRPLALPGDRRLGDAEEQLGHARLQPRGLDGAERGQRLHQRLRRAARLGDDDEARVGEIEGAERRLQRDGIEVVVEARARPPPLRLVGHAGDVPAAELGQRLAAEARAADAEEDDGVGALREPVERRLGRGEVGGLLGDAQVRQPAGAVVLLQRRDARARADRASAPSSAALSPCWPMAPSRQPAIECRIGRCAMPLALSGSWREP